MPTPVSTSSSRPRDVCDANELPICQVPPEAPEPNASATAEETQEQVYSYADLAAASVVTPAAKATAPAAPPPAYANADRTAARTPSDGPYAEAGRVADHWIWFAGAAAVKAHDPVSHVDMELMSVSAQGGTQTELQVGLGRLGVSSETGRSAIGITVLTAEAHAGFHNPDGSLGKNDGASATLIGVEGTLERSGWSITLGAAVGPGVEGSIGVRDQDGDGRPELCVRASAGPTGGLCVEKFW